MNINFLRNIIYFPARLLYLIDDNVEELKKIILYFICRKLDKGCGKLQIDDTLLNFVYLLTDEYIIEKNDKFNRDIALDFLNKNFIDSIYCRGFDSKKSVIYLNSLKNVINNLSKNNLRNILVSNEIPCYKFSLSLLIRQLLKEYIEKNQSIYDIFFNYLIFYYPKISKKRKIESQNDVSYYLFFNSLKYSKDVLDDIAIKEALLDIGSEYDNFLVGNYFPYCPIEELFRYNNIYKKQEFFKKLKENNRLIKVETIFNSLLGYFIIPEENLSRYAILLHYNEEGTGISAYKIIDKRELSIRFIYYYNYFNCQENSIYVITKEKKNDFIDEFSYFYGKNIEEKDFEYLIK